MTINENIRFTDYASGIRLPDALALNYKIGCKLENSNDVTIC